MASIDLEEVIAAVRLIIADDDPTKNIITQKLDFTDPQITLLIKRAIRDINQTSPNITNYTVNNFPADFQNLVEDGAIIQALIASGLLQLKNQLDYNGSGLTIAMFNKTGAYQGWAGFLLQNYIRDKISFKRGVLMRSANSGFVGISTPFDPYYDDNGEW